MPFCKVKKVLRGVKVEVTHRGNVRRKYRISGLTSQPTRELMYIKSSPILLILHFRLYFSLWCCFNWVVLLQFPSWWADEHEICSWILPRDVWIYHSVYTFALPSSRKPEEGELSTYGGQFRHLSPSCLLLHLDLLSAENLRDIFPRRVRYSKDRDTQKDWMKSK